LLSAMRRKAWRGARASCLLRSSVVVFKATAILSRTSSEGCLRPSSTSDKNGADIFVFLASSRTERSSFSRNSRMCSPRVFMFFVNRKLTRERSPRQRGREKRKLARDTLHQRSTKPFHHHAIFHLCRKSTEDDDHQAISLESQRRELVRFAESHALSVTGILFEKKSARDPHRYSLSTRCPRRPWQSLPYWFLWGLNLLSLLRRVKRRLQ
jgi:hypothetical protein